MTTVYKVHEPYLPNGNMKYSSISCTSMHIVDLLKLSAESNGEKYGNKSMVSDWPNIEIKHYDAKKKSGADFYILANSFFTLSPKAVEAMRDFLLPYGEFLPIYGKNIENLIIYRLYSRYEVLDMTKCIAEFICENPPYVSYFKKYSFIEEAIQKKPIFRPTQTFQIYVTDVFLRRYQEANLTGLGFQMVWSSEKGSISGDSLFILPPDIDLNL